MSSSSTRPCWRAVRSISIPRSTSYDPATSQGALAAGRSLEPFIARLNKIRRLHPALQQLRNITFHGVDNDALLAYSKFDPITGDCVLVVVTLNAFGAGRGDVVVGHGRIGYGALRAVLGPRRDNRRGIPMGTSQLCTHRPWPRTRPHHQHAAHTVRIPNDAAAPEVTPR